MKLFFAAASPFARKVTVCAAELGIVRWSTSRPRHTRSTGTAASLPATRLGKVPTAIADDGTVLYDSRVICEYLDALGGGGKLFPASGTARWRALTEQALADGLMDAGILLRYEALTRPPEKQSADWQAGQTDKMTCALDELEKQAVRFRLAALISAPSASAARSAGSISASVTLAWRTGRPMPGEPGSRRSRRDPRWPAPSPA